VSYHFFVAETSMPQSSYISSYDALRPTKTDAHPKFTRKQPPYFS